MKRYFLHILNIRENTDFEKTRSTISEGVSLRGYNLWILVCATILASIGLDTNSTAVIIGAMLISPLMSPILGVGFSLAIHDKNLLIRSFRNLFMAVIISLAASILYFFLSPLSESTPELQGRTFPTLLDVLVALFGGIAGIVSISRHDQTNAIPGVAIATALMPPLCTAGFGIATLHWNYFFGAIYLFFINAVFISLATYLVTRYLHFPEKEFVNKKLARQYRAWLIVTSIVALTPSIYFLYSVYSNELVKKDIDEFVISPIKKQGNEILKWELVNRDTAKLIKVYHSGRPLSDSLKNSIDSTLHAHRMASYHFVATRINLTKDEVDQLTTEKTRQIVEEMHLNEIKEQKVPEEKSTDTLSFPKIFEETRIAFPYIDTMYNGWVMYPNKLKSIDTVPIVFYKTHKVIKKAEFSRLYNFLLARFSKDTVILIKK